MITAREVLRDQDLFYRLCYIAVELAAYKDRKGVRENGVDMMIDGYRVELTPEQSEDMLRAIGFDRRVDGFIDPTHMPDSIRRT